MHKKRKLFFIKSTLFLIALSVSVLFLSTYSKALAVNVVPSAVCGGSVSCIPSGASPTTFSLSSIPSVPNPSTPAQTSGIPISSGPSAAPSITPCTPSTTASIQSRRQRRKHSKHGHLSNSMDQLLQFLLNLLNELFKLLEGNGGGINIPGLLSGTPSGAVNPSTPATNPSASPCNPSAAPSAAVPSSTIPSSTVPTLTGTVLSPSVPVSTTCTNPVWTTSDPNGMWNTNGYFVHNNAWNAANYTVSQTLYACAYNNWYVVANMNDTGDGAVKTYPDVHKDYNEAPLSSFKTVTSSYAHVAPTVGNWDYAYDIWINGVGNGAFELMIWTEALGKQASAIKGYPSMGTVTLSGITYTVHKNGNNYVAFEMTPYKNSGTINLKEIFNYIISKGWIASSSTLGQIDYGVEVVSTNGAPATFKFTNFSITTN